MSTEAKMKVGMIGVGKYGAVRRGHMRRTGLFEIVACYNRSQPAMEQCRQEDGARITGSYEELLETPGIEAMFICTGAMYHAAQTRQALERGLHVFVEKPLCSTPEEMRTLLDLQRRTGLVVGVGHEDHTHDAESRIIKGMIDRGELGVLVAFEKTTCHSGGLHIKPGDWRGDAEKNPGGMLFQCGVHCIHELMYYFGPIKSVFSRMKYDLHTTPTADVAHCILELDSGLLGTLSAYHITPYRHHLNIYGTKRNIYRDSKSWREEKVFEMQDVGQNDEMEPRVPILVTEKSDPTGHIRSFYHAVRNGGTPYPSIVDGARAVAVVFAAETSAKTGKTVMVERIA
jgi:predicted dehydrogenase